jgi:hypothetical protein
MFAEMPPLAISIAIIAGHRVWGKKKLGKILWSLY